MAHREEGEEGLFGNMTLSREVSGNMSRGGGGDITEACLGVVSYCPEGGGERRGLQLLSSIGVYGSIME